MQEVYYFVYQEPIDILIVEGYTLYKSFQEAEQELISINSHKIPTEKPFTIFRVEITEIKSADAH